MSENPIAKSSKFVTVHVTGGLIVVYTTKCGDVEVFGIFPDEKTRENWVISRQVSGWEGNFCLEELNSC